MEAYQHDDIHRYEATLQKNPDILKDTFIKENINEITRNIRSRAMLKLITPYRDFKLEFVSRRLNIPIEETQFILSFLISDGKFSGRISHSGAVRRIDSVDNSHVEAMEKLTAALDRLEDVLMQPESEEKKKITEPVPDYRTGKPTTDRPKWSAIKQNTARRNVGSTAPVRSKGPERLKSMEGYY